MSEDGLSTAASPESNHSGYQGRSGVQSDDDRLSLLSPGSNVSSRDEEMSHTDDDEDEDVDVVM